MAASLSCLGLALGLAACGSDDGGGEGQPFYEGKTVELIVPFDTGGGTDTIARFLAPLLSEHIEGNPEVQVVNIPGADTMIGHNEFAQREADGLSWFMGGASGTFYFLFDNPDAQYDYADWEPILGVPQGAVVYVSPDTGVTDATELPDAESELVFGARSPEGADLARLFTLDFLGIEYTPVFGYDGSGPSRIAFEQGESNLNADTTTAYIESVQPLVDAGTAVPLYSQGQMVDGHLARDPAVPDLPHVGEVYEQIHGSPATGPMMDAHELLVTAGSTFNKILFAHADAPDRALEAIRAGVAEAVNDPEYADGVESILEGYEISIGEEFDSTIERILSPDEQTVEFIKDYATENYDANMG